MQESIFSSIDVDNIDYSLDESLGAEEICTYDKKKFRVGRKAFKKLQSMKT